MYWISFVVELFGESVKNVGQVIIGFVLNERDSSLIMILYRKDFFLILVISNSLEILDIN